ncbi:hypothetical protein E2C01_089411 [Portunus trituberculatus]|uniref:Uncharacterized protein n=1 Tax=Portunus trituberculatus TaxID=210409 RepID=A0A5B7JH46_PORTR|nr:hypothetical protein [Portunus trituberculatus]
MINGKVLKYWKPSEFLLGYSGMREFKSWAAGSSGGGGSGGGIGESCIEMKEGDATIFTGGCSRAQHRR